MSNEIMLDNTNILNDLFYTTIFLSITGTLIVIHLFRRKILSLITSLLAFSIITFSMNHYRNSQLNSKWYIAETHYNQLTVTLANDRKKSFSCNDVLSVMPRFEKTGCSIIIRTKTNTHTSAKVSKGSCRDLSNSIKRSMNCSN